MKKFNIADILIEMDTNNQSILNRFQIFASDRNNQSDLRISFNESIYITAPQGQGIIDQGIKWLNKDNVICASYIKGNTNEIQTLLEVDNTWRNANLIYIPKNSRDEYPICGRLDEALFYGHILLHNGIIIHASAIEWNGKGILFSAPGDTGKSTHAGLWKKYLNAKTLNDDRPAVRIMDDIPVVYGTPWCGSSTEIVNRHSPLSAIIIIERALQNTVCELAKHEAVARVFPRCFLPYFDKRLVEIALNTVEKIIISTPIYLLRCRPDREAMELVFNCVK